MNLAFLNGFSVLLTSFIVVVVVVLLMLIFLLQFLFFFIELYSAHLIYAVAMFFDMPILYFMALSYIYILIGERGGKRHKNSLDILFPFLKKLELKWS